MLTTVKQRLLAGFGFMVLMLLLLGMFSLNKINMLGQTANDMYNHPMKVYTSILSVEVGIVKIHRDMKDVVLSPDSNMIQVAVNRVSKEEQVVYQHLQTAKGAILGDEGVMGVTRLENLFRQWKPIRDEVIELTKAGRKREAADITRQKGVDHIRKLETEIDSLLRYVDGKAKGFYDGANTAWNSATTTILALIVFAILSGFTVAVILMKQVSIRLLKLSETIHDIEVNSDLVRRVNINTSCEIGDTARAFNQMLGKFSHIVQQVNSSTEKLSVTTEQVKIVAGQSKKDAENQRLETERVATAMNEMAATIAEVSRNAESAAQAASAADNEAQTGKNIVFSTTTAINELDLQIGVVSEVVAQLKEDSESIGTVLDVIKGIAEQTNLLALNAAIEAARAGEQGRGFAVVADEVRTLASRTQESTHEIEGMIERLQQGSHKAVEAIDIGKSLARDGASHATRSGDSLSEITRAVSVINEMSSQIATAAEQQKTVAEEMNINITNINQSAEQTATGAGKTAVATDALHQLASQLQQEVTEFKMA